VSFLSVHVGGLLLSASTVFIKIWSTLQVHV